MAGGSGVINVAAAAHARHRQTEDNEERSHKFIPARATRGGNAPPERRSGPTTWQVGRDWHREPFRHFRMHSVPPRLMVLRIPSTTRPPASRWGRVAFRTYGQCGQPTASGPRISGRNCALPALVFVTFSHAPADAPADGTGLRRRQAARGRLLFLEVREGEAGSGPPWRPRLVPRWSLAPQPPFPLGRPGWTPRTLRTLDAADSRNPCLGKLRKNGGVLHCPHCPHCPAAVRQDVGGTASHRGAHRRHRCCRQRAPVGCGQGLSPGTTPRPGRSCTRW